MTDYLPGESPANATPVWIAPNPVRPVLTHIDAPGSTLIKRGAGWVAEISVNTAGTSGSLTIYDGTDATGNVMAVMDIAKQGSSATGSEFWPFHFGLFVVLSAVADITIISN